MHIKYAFSAQSNRSRTDTSRLTTRNKCSRIQTGESFGVFSIYNTEEKQHISYTTENRWQQ